MSTGSDSASPATHEGAGPTPLVSTEAPLTLTDRPPRTLSGWAQTAMWASFGISLFGPLTGALVALSVGSQAAGLAACALGTVIGALLLGGAAAIGAKLGTPSMVGLRGLLGRRTSIVPTVLNIAQNIGWAMMEIIVIASAATSIVGDQWRWFFVILAGILTCIMAVHPLGSVKILRLVMLWLVLVGSIYLFVMVLRSPARPVDQSGVIGFWPAVDLAAAQVISFAPLAADYSRHSKTTGGAFGGAAVGYGLATFGYYALGVFAVAHLPGDLTGTELLTALMALPAGAFAIGLLLIDELDNAFADIYSATVSVHNLAPHVDRRIISVAVALIATLLAGFMGFDQYESFLYLIGSAFIPLFTVAVVDFFAVRRQRWDITEHSSFRWAPLVAWIIGFIAYQLIYPGTVPGWSPLWAGIDEAIGFVAPTWLGSTLGTMVVSGLAAWILGVIETRHSDKPLPEAPTSD